MDDFGTGYSSLSNLRISVRQDQDRQVVCSRCDRQRRQRCDCSRGDRLGTSLGITVTAEGSAAADAEIAARRRLPGGAGIFFSRPMPVERIDDFLQSRARRPHREPVEAAA